MLYVFWNRDILGSVFLHMWRTAEHVLYMFKYGHVRDLLFVDDGRYSCFPGEYWYSLIGQSVYENRIGFLNYDLVRSISTSWFDGARRVIYN